MDADADGELAFYEDSRDNKSAWGCYVVKRMPNSKKHVVPVVHFSKWVEYNIFQRRLPEKVHGEGDNTKSPSGVLFQLENQWMRMGGER